MTFLNPLVLFGLIAAAIPIIIHLLNLRKLKTIEFSTLQFLKELQKTKMRRVKIKQWLLLALRTLLIIALVMAFSRPALRGTLAGFGIGGTTAKTTLVLLLDDSPSMGVRNERGTFFAQAKDAANHVLDLMREGDEVFLIKLSDVRHASSFPSAHAAAPVRTLLEHLTPSQERVPFRGAFGAAAKLLAESKNFNQELYLITDGQATQFEQVKHVPDTTDVFDDKVKLFVADLGGGTSKTIENAGIRSVEIPSTIITQDKPIILQASVRHSGSSPLHNTVLSAYLDGTRLVQRSLDIAAGGSATAALSIVPKRRGILAGYLQLDDDAFEPDNKRYFVVHVPKSIRILCVGGSLNDIRLPALALTLDNDSSTAGLFSLEQIIETQLASYDLNKYDLLLLSNVKDFSTGEADRITQFCNAGGGVLMFAGKDMDIANYNTVLFPKLGVQPLLPPRVPGNSPPGADSSFLSFGKVEFEHPLFAGLFEQPTGKKAQPSIESPRVYRTVVPQLGVKGRSIITLADGTSFLTEYECGEGKILLVAVEAGLTWSDFPLKGVFVPLLYRSGLYLTQTPPSQSLIVGDEMKMSVRLKSRTDKDVFVVRSPSGIDERTAPQFSPNSAVANFVSNSSSEAGIYQLLRTSGGKDAEMLQAIPVNIAPEETDLSHASKDQMDEFFARLGLKPEQIRQITATENMDNAILETRYGVELWKHFLIAAVLLALAEMAIGREAKGRST
jgi:hypothetical protein